MSGTHLVSLPTELVALVGFRATRPTFSPNTGFQNVLSSNSVLEITLDYHTLKLLLWQRKVGRVGRSSERAVVVRAKRRREPYSKNRIQMRERETERMRTKQQPRVAASSTSPEYQRKREKERKKEGKLSLERRASESGELEARKLER